MKKCLLLLALVCLLGNSALAQNYTSVGSIDFSGLSDDGGCNNVQWVNNGNVIQSTQGRNFVISSSNPSREFTMSVDYKDGWNIWDQYFQRSDQYNQRSVYINGLQQGDKIKITPVNGFQINSNNTDKNQGQRYTSEQEVTINSTGSVEIKFTNQYDGIRKIEFFVQQQGQQCPF